MLIQDMIDRETGEVYPALSCCNDKIMADRCKVENAPNVIWSIKASASFNSEICTLLRSGFQKGKINLLVSEFECEEILKSEVKGSNIKIYEKSGQRKDRYSSLAYNYWVQCQLEREFLKQQNKSFNILDYAKEFRKLNKRPITY